MSILEDDEDEGIEWGDIPFDPSATLIYEQCLIDEVWYRISNKPWSKNYLDREGNRKFTITLAFGLLYELRVSLGTNINIIIRGTNVLPGGQVFLTDPKVMDAVINILWRFNKSLISSSLVPIREIHKWRKDHAKWKRDTFNYDIPENLIFQVPKEEVELITMETSVRMVVQDKITKAFVEIEAKNEDTNLMYQRAAAKLYILRELKLQEGL